MTQKQRPRLYVVTLDGGSSHPEFSKFLTNVSELGGKSPDYGGITRVAIVSSRNDLENLKKAASRKVRNKRAIDVEEVTTESVAANHRVYIGTFEYFARFNDYPAIDLAKARSLIEEEYRRTLS